MDLLRFSVVLMLQIPQSVDKNSFTNKLIENFEELKSAQFQNLPQVPDNNFPIILANTPSLNVNITPVIFAFDFDIKAKEDLYEKLNQKVKIIKSVVNDCIVGNYRLGIVVTGSTSDLDEYKQLAKTIINVDLDEMWFQTQFSVRTKHTRLIIDKDVPVNVWKRIDFDKDAGIGNITIDINTNASVFLSIEKYDVEDTWKTLKYLLEECINELHKR